MRAVLRRPLTADARPAAEVHAPARARGRHLPVVHRVLALRDALHARLLRASALERLPPERYGFSAATAAWLYLVTTLFYRRYFRVQSTGIAGLPSGPAMLVANHGSHVLSWDGANIITACLLEADPPRLVHGMAEHRLMELPILGRVARRIGAVDGRRETCSSLLTAGATVLVFPEGTGALERPFRDRYRLLPFRHGFVHVALATGVPIVPVAVVGAEEEAPLLANPRWLRRLLGTPTAPLTPTLFVPLPVRYRIRFGAPIVLSGPPTARRVARYAEHVRGMVGRLLAEERTAREHIFF